MNIRTERRKLYTPWHKCRGYNKHNKITYLYSEDLDQPVHLHILISVFAVCMKIGNLDTLLAKTDQTAWNED